MKVDQATYEEIKATKDDGVSSKDCAEQMGLDLGDVNEAYASKSYESYAGIPLKKPTETKIITPMKKGNFAGLVAKKYEKNDSLRETQNLLSKNISSLWNIIRLLESRKRHLEGEVLFMESYIQNGTRIIEDDIETE